MLKQVLFFLVLQFSFQNLYPQDSIYTSICTGIYDGNSTGFSNHITRYDSLGNIIREDYFGLGIDASGSGYPTTGFHNYVTYDYFNNHLSHRTEYQSDASGNFTIINEHSYDYDVSGNRITDTIYYNGIPNNYYKYFWNSQNDTISIEWYADSSGFFILKDLKTIQRDLNSRPVDRMHFSYSGAQVNNVDRQIITYDNYGNIASYNSLYGTFNGWVDVGRMFYHYSANGFLDAYGKSSFTSGNWDMNDTLNTIFNSDSTINHTMTANWYHSNLNDSAVSDFVYDLNKRIILQNTDHFHYQGQFWIHDSERIVINRMPDGTPLDSTYMLFNGTTFQNESQILFHYSGVDTVDMYTVICINGVCQDTIELERIIYTGPGNSYSRILYDYYSSGSSSYANSGVTYNGLNQVTDEYSNWNVPGEQDHSHSTNVYDGNGNLLHSWHGQSGHAGTPYVEGSCDYSWTIGNATTMNTNLMLTDIMSCQHSPLFGFININGGQAPYAISWDDTSGIAYANTINPVFYPDSIMARIIYVTDALGQQDTIIVNLQGQSYDLQLTSTGFCMGDTITALINPTPTNVNYYYLNVGGNSYGMNTNPLFIINNSNINGYFYVSFFTECGQVAYSDSIFIDEAPYLDLGQDRNICSNDTLVLTSFSYFPYTWYDGDTATSHEFTTGGTYWATSENSQHCMIADSIHLTHESVNFSLGNDTLICTNQSLVLNAGPGFVNYYWYDNTFGQVKVFTTTIPDTIQAFVSVFSNHSCMYTDTMQIIAQVCSGIDESENEFSVSPNPCEDFLFVKSGGVDKIKMKLMNSSGIVLLESEISGNSFIDMRNYNKGIYLLEMTNGNDRWLRKIIH